MPLEVIMPKVDMDMASGTINAWYVGEGEAVSKGEPLFSIETDKAAMEVDAPGDGVVHHRAPEGSEIAIGEPVAWLYAEGEDVGERPTPLVTVDRTAGGTADGTANDGATSASRSDATGGREAVATGDAGTGGALTRGDRAVTSDVGAEEAPGRGGRAATNDVGAGEALGGRERTATSDVGAEEAPGRGERAATSDVGAREARDRGARTAASDAGVGETFARAERAAASDAGNEATSRRDERAAAQNAAPSAVRGGTRATPRARALARDAGLDIATLRGSGPRGRVQAEDVRSVSRGFDAVSGRVTFTPQSGPLAVVRGPGGRGTPIVLIHGFASDAMSWAPLERHVDDRPLFRIELPCHGKSPRRPIDGFATLAREVRRAFDELHPEPVHLVGHSLGGALCLALADTRPRSVASLTLIAPAGLGPDVNAATLTGLCRASRPESLGPWLRTLVADESIVTDSYVRLSMASRTEAELRAAQTAMAETLFPDGVQAFDLRPALGRVDVPTRIVWGKRDEIIPWRHALRAPGRVALHLFDDVGHLPQIERAADVAAIVRAQG